MIIGKMFVSINLEIGVLGTLCIVQLYVILLGMLCMVQLYVIFECKSVPIQEKKVSAH